jgi:hypothetical protein
VTAQQSVFLFLSENKMVEDKFKRKVAKVMREFKQGNLKAGAGKAPKVKSPKQAVAIALSSARRKAYK